MITNKTYISNLWFVFHNLETAKKNEKNEKNKNKLTL